MKVDRLLVDPRRKGCIRIVVNGRLAWSVPADVITELGLVEGSPIPGQAIAVLERGADEEGAFRAALRSLERRAHGERELAHKLERKGHTDPAVHAAMARLRRLGLLDDLTFAKQYAASKSERGRGPFRIRHDLAGLGITPAVIDAALGAVAEVVEDPLAKPRALAARRLKQMAGLPHETRRRRLAAFLARRGYQGEERTSILRELLRGNGGD